MRVGHAVVLWGLLPQRLQQICRCTLLCMVLYWGHTLLAAGAVAMTQGFDNCVADALRSNCVPGGCAASSAHALLIDWSERLTGDFGQQQPQNFEHEYFSDL